MFLNIEKPNKKNDRIMNEITQITVYVIWNKIRANIQFPPPCVTCMFTFIEKKNQKKNRKKISRISN